MEVIALLLIVIILFVLLNLKGNVSDKLADLNEKIEELTKTIKRISAEQQQSVSKEQTQVSERRQALEKLSHRTQPVTPEKTPEIKEIRPETPKPIQKEEIKEPVAPVATSVPKKENVKRENAPIPQRDPVRSFFERNPDLEKFIGENLANKIGIAILVLGIGFFVKYAIDQNWINEIGRVFIGILCGGLLLGIAHQLRKTFNAFSSVLVGGGIAVLYFTIAIAFHEYHIFNQTAAFILMVGITAFTIVLSLGYNRVELAVLAILGGFGSPFMVSTGEGNYIVLFTYMIILNVGMLILAYYKKWRVVNIICYLFTMLIFGGWLGSRFVDTNVSMIRGSLIFATLFYLIFFVMNIINNIKERTKFEALEILMLLSNTFLYYTAGMITLDNTIGNDFKGLFTAALGVFNFIFAYMLYKNQRVDRNLVFMLIGLVLTFISLAAPIQLEGNYITLFWAAEAVVLLWLSKKSGITLIKMASVLVVFLMCISLIIDWKQIYFDNLYDGTLPIILNKGYITSLVALASLILTYILLRDEKDESFFSTRNYRIAITLAAVVFLYIAHLLELRYHLINYVDQYATQSVIIGTYNMFFILMILLSEKRMNIPDELKKIFPFWGIIAMGSYLFFYHELVIDTRNDYLNGISTSTGFVFHYLLVVLLIVNVLLSLRKLNALKNLTEAIYHGHWWLYIIFFVFIASAELDHTVLLTAFTEEGSAGFILNQNHKIGFPILWGIASFILIAVGLQRKIKTLRIISLALLFVTLLKLFIIDLQGISEGGKIAAFISLGILLLVVSFMYQRLKKILLEDNTSEETEKAV